MMVPDLCLSVCLSVVYIGPKLRTERLRNTKIGTEVPTRDSDTIFKVKRSKVKITWAGAYCGGFPPTACFDVRLSSMTRLITWYRISRRYDRRASAAESCLFITLWRKQEFFSITHWKMLCEVDKTVIDYVPVEYR